MSALPLFDSIFLAIAGHPSAAVDANRLTRFLDQLVRAAMTDLGEIESLDRELAHSRIEEFDPHTAVLLRGMYETWAREVDAVLARVEKVQRLGISNESADELRAAQGRILAMLRVTTDDVFRGRSQFQSGRVWTREQIRGELGLGV